MAFWDNDNNNVARDNASLFNAPTVEREEQADAVNDSDTSMVETEPEEPREETVEATVDVEAEPVQPEPVKDTADATAGETVEPRRRRAAHQAKPFPKLDADTVEKILTLGDALADERTLKLAQAFTGVGSPKVSVQAALLTEKKTQQRVGELYKLTEKLNDAEPSDLKMLLVFTLGEDKQLAQLLFAAVNALAPERGFGKPSGDAMKDTMRFADKWGEGVDLQPVGLLRV